MRIRSKTTESADRIDSPGTILGGLAQRIVHQNVPDILSRRLFTLNMQALIGKSYLNFLDEYYFIKDCRNL